MKDLYVTGTDTGIGKTLAGVVLLHALRARGVRVVGMKPVASGCALHDGQWRNDDALALQAASDPRPDYDDVNPYALPLATAPEIAARQAGVDLALPRIASAHRRLQAQADVVVVEGVGGWAAPLSPALDQVDLVRQFDLHVVVVVGLRLGCINHARLTVRAIEADNATVAGWIGNDIDPQMEHRDAYLELLRLRMPGPCLGHLPFAPGAPADALAALLDVSALM